MVKVDCNYRVHEDIKFIMECEKINRLELSQKTNVSRHTLDVIEKNGTARGDVLEKIYSYAYERNYRINTVKEEIIKEKYKDILFHGSKDGLEIISKDGSKHSSDFGKGFYLGETYNQALAFVCEKDRSSVYSFRYSLKDLNIKKFECNLEWMLAICYFRGTIKPYESSRMIKDIIDEVMSADVVIAPIADNKMFYVMAQFADGEINADVAIHSLSASKLGLQYVFRTEKAIKKLSPIERYYLSDPEREDCKQFLIERGYEIDTKLKLAKREFKTGLFIEEILK